MWFYLKAACLSNTGCIRSNNEDNFFFGGKHLPEKNDGLTKPLKYGRFLWKPHVAAVFDGMGGEQFGETASFVAAQGTKAAVISAENIPAQLEQLCLSLNEQVFEKAETLFTTHMGSTMAMLCFSRKRAYVCNLGDSRIFRYHLGVLEQISEDHTDEKTLRARGIKRKAQLTQHLGVDPQELRLVPHIAEMTLQRGDRYLICSDGLTDMVSQGRIRKILQENSKPAACAEALVEEARKNGGRDNITVIVCAV